MAVPAAVLSILVQANTGGATRGLMRFNSQLGATEAKSNRALGAVKTLAKGSAVATGIGLGYAVKKAADFEQQLDSLGSVSDASGKQMERFRKQAMKAGADTKFSALDAAVAQTELAKGGLKVKQIMRGGLAAALSLAAAGEMELGEAAATTANALNLFGLEGKSSMKVADALAKAANATTADVTDFAMALRQSGGVAKTAGLSFSETVLALEALANAGTKNSDAGTSLKTALIQLIKPTEKQQALATKLNLSFLDAEGNFKNLADVSTMLRDRLGGMTAAQRTATLATLAGTDGVRTLTALYDAGPSKLDKWKKGLNESGTAAEVAAQKQDNLKGKLENLQGSIETAAIGIGTKLLPTLTKAATALTKLINDPKLTGGEKFARFMEMVTQAVEKAVPVVAAAGVKVAGALASGLARGWREMNPLMKLFTAAAVIRLAGGRGALFKTGATLGGFLGAGVSAGAAAGVAGGGAAVGAGAGAGMIAAMRARVLPIAKRLGLAGVGIALADVVISEFGRRSAAKGGDMFKMLEAKSRDTPVKLPLLPSVDLANLDFSESQKAAQKLSSGLREIQKSQQGIGHERAEALRKEIGKLDDVTPGARRALGELVDGFERTGAKARAVDSAIERMKTGSSKSIASLRTNVRFNTRAIRQALGEDTAAGRKAMSENFRAAISNVRKSMKEGTITTKQGTAEIERLMVAALQNMGFTKEQALDARRSKKSGSRNAPGAPGQGARPNQRGGPIMEGALSGDSVPSILERGEYVLNRKAVRAVGKSKLDQINFKHAPRFQSGGMVRIPGDPDTTGGRDKVAASIAQAVGSWIKRYKIQVGYAFDPGGGHQSPGHNVTGTALDVVPGIGGSWDTLEAGLKAAVAAGKTVYYGTNGIGQALENHGRGNHGHVEWGGSGGVSGSAGAVVAKLIDRMVVDGPDSLLKANVQGALDVTRSAANALIKSKATSAGGDGSFAGLDMAGSGPWKKIQARIAKANGWSLRDWNILIGKESGGDPTAVNPDSGAFGIGQFLGPTKDAYAKYGATSTDPRMQIQAMAKYISDRYGNPSKALAFHLANNYYKKGGLVGMQAGGPVRSYPLAQKGDIIGRPYQGTHSLGNWQSDNAIDIGVPMGTIVKAVTSGKIGGIKGGWGGGASRFDGYQVYLDNDSQWWYTHLKSIQAKTGQAVGAGQAIGTSGAANGVPHIHLGRDKGSPLQAAGWPIADASRKQASKTGGAGGGGGRGNSGPHPIGKLAYVGDSLGVGTLGAGLKGKLGKIGLASKASVGKTSSWGVDALKGMLGGAGAAMLDMGTNDGTAGNLRPSINAVKGMLKGKPLLMASIDPDATDAAKKNAAIRANADRVIPWAGIAEKFASDKVHPTGAGYSRRAQMVAAAAKGIRVGGPAAENVPKELRKAIKRGPLSQALKKTMKLVRQSDSKKQRSKALRMLEKRIRKIGAAMPPALQKAITGLTNDAAVYDEYANRAGQLTGDEEGAPQGLVGGKTETEWLQAELGKLFSLRNKLIEAEKIIEKRRDMVAKLLEQARKRLDAVAAQIRDAGNHKRQLEKQLEETKAHPDKVLASLDKRLRIANLNPKRNKALIKDLEKQKAHAEAYPQRDKERLKDLRGKIEAISTAQAGRVRERNALDKRIIPALTDRQGKMVTARGDVLDQLDTVQGIGSPMGKLAALPEFGILGGTIFDTQMRLRDIGAKTTATDTTSSETESESASLLKQLLDEANLRTAVSQKQYEVLRNMPPYGGQFATGGVVPGPIGAARTIVAHGGETVTPPGNGAPNIQINLGAGMEWLDRYIEVKVDGVTRKQARAGARGLPGRGGGF